MDQRLFMEALGEALIYLACPLSQSQRQQLCLHWQLCVQWSGAMNLTALQGAQEAAWLHMADSLLPLPHVERGTWLDVGSGAGFPGIPLAIARPDIQWRLLEPRAKRCSFLKMVVMRLGLTHCHIVQGRLETLSSFPIDGAVSRATFSDLQSFAPLANFLPPSGSLWALVRPEAGMKGIVREVILQGRPRALIQRRQSELEADLG